MHFFPKALPSVYFHHAVAHWSVFPSAIGRETPLRGGEPIGAGSEGRASRAPEASARATRGPPLQSRVSTTTLSMCQRDSPKQQPADMKTDKAEKTKPKVSETRKVISICNISIYISGVE